MVLAARGEFAVREPFGALEAGNAAFSARLRRPLNRAGCARAS